MILLQSHSRYLLQILSNRVQNLEKGVELDCHWVEFDDVRYHIQASMKNPHILLLSVSLPTPPLETVFVGGLPTGAIEAMKAAYGLVVQILDPPRDGFNLTVKLNLSKLPPDEEYRNTLLVKIASVREVVMGAPLRVVLKRLTSRAVAQDTDQLVALVHRPMESFFLAPLAEKVTVVFPMRFKDSTDTVLATSFLQEHVMNMPQEFVEARRTAGLSNAPPCSWSPSPPLELKDAPAEALSTNAGFVSFVIFPRHVEGKKLDKTVWNLSTFHAYVNYHVKALDRAKPDTEKSKKTGQNRSFKRLVCPLDINPNAFLLIVTVISGLTLLLCPLHMQSLQESRSRLKS
ncbi:hypothetical protein TEA_013815 [Camellia sinensis var. sinensis]|uniref:Arp2/3 complex 34 kDa subunit n=1 Tax=Camellia sinensis var. sinensis TaxID=542762 RepID=A0A4S4DJB0_CAMSN|nr:hypothetical protein TEA_013815 [Camellia sinensis var. sinensis]